MRKLFNCFGILFAPAYRLSAVGGQGVSSDFENASRIFRNLNPASEMMFEDSLMASPMSMFLLKMMHEWNLVSRYQGGKTTTSSLNCSDFSIFVFNFSPSLDRLI